MPAEISSLAEPQLPASVRRASELAAVDERWQGVLPTTYSSLDAQLPGGGWPLGALVELIAADVFMPVWPLLLPAIPLTAATAAAAAVEALEEGKVEKMKVFYAEEQKRHDPKFFLSSGGRQPNPEQPERVERLLDGDDDDQRRGDEEPGRHGQSGNGTPRATDRPPS